MYMKTSVQEDKIQDKFLLEVNHCIQLFPCILSLAYSQQLLMYSFYVIPVHIYTYLSLGKNAHTTV